MDNQSTVWDCNNPSDQMAIAATHVISQTVFDQYMSNYWGGDADTVEPMVLSWATMSEQMSSASCTTTCWKFEMDSADKTNNDITPGFQTLSGGVPPGYNPDITYYSFALFKGAYLNNSADSFYFFKAQTADNKYVVIFQAMNSNTVVACYDIAGEYP